ncbi:right-handed parallel beta-helix repeat-containing protein [Paenibacillus mesophilus]|uniref:right-handed parallel beta-helix repeat-containing protein n=1 Tax=Paenibacillus mesophilus TaxID=2582849 RepID=UPI00110EBE35|nr:right-handed parallel beta-helix repeat-containing protein [Paenibacillus mesophilus]TMV45040.1 right-handed parallel beta-helix repeat-containing protein [Paenibacillus mesophilus]
MSEAKAPISRRKALAALGMAGAAISLLASGVSGSGISVSKAVYGGENNGNNGNNKNNEEECCGPVMAASIEQLRNTAAAGSGDVVWVVGYYADTPGSGGGAFLADLTDTTTADNGGTAIVAADGTRWKRIDTSPLAPEMFGARNGEYSQAACQAGLLAAAGTASRSFRFTDGFVYRVASLYIPSGVAKVYGRGEIRAESVVDQLLYTKGPIFGGTADIRCDIEELYVNCNGKARQGILLNGVSDSTVSGCTVTGLSVSGGNGIRVATNCSNIDLSGNTIRMSKDNPVGTYVTLNGILITAEIASDYGGVDTAGAPVYPAVTTTDIRCSGNRIYDGTHGIHVRGLVRGEMSGNTINGSSHRNINLSPACRRIAVYGNQLHNARSSGVNVAWGCERVIVEGNVISSYVSSAENTDDAAIQVYKDGTGITIANNNISGDWKYGVFLSQVKHFTVTGNNFIDGGSLANIGIETDFAPTVPAAAIYSKARSAVAAATDTYNGTISGNVHGGTSAAISLAAFGGKSLREIGIGTETVRGSARSHVLYVYADAASLIPGSIDVSGIGGSYPSGAGYYSSIGRAAFGRIADAVGFEDPTREIVVTGSTPSVFRGPNIAVGDASTITDFVDGANGQRLSVRLFAGATIVNDDGKIRLKGAANITGDSTAGRKIVTFMRRANIWFEESRNF